MPDRPRFPMTLTALLKLQGIGPQIAGAIGKLVDKKTKSRVFDELSHYYVMLSHNRKMGSCNYRTKIITINPVLFDPEHAEELDDTIRHEIAHAIMYVVRPGHKRPHNKDWKLIAKVLGATPMARSQNAEASQAVKQAGLRRITGYKVVAVCQKCNYELVRRKMLNRGRTYSHVGCEGIFIPVTRALAAKKARS